MPSDSSYLSLSSLQAALDRITQFISDQLNFELPGQVGSEEWGTVFRDLLESLDYRISETTLQHLRRNSGLPPTVLTATSLEGYTTLVQEFCLSHQAERSGKVVARVLLNECGYFLKFLSADTETLAHRAYLGRFLAPVRVPQEHLMDPEIKAAQQLLTDKCVHFRKAYIAHEKALQVSGDPQKLTQELYTFDCQRETLQGRVAALRESLPSAHAVLLPRAAQLREAEAKFQDLSARITEATSLAEAGDARLKQLRQRAAALGLDAADITALEGGAPLKRDAAQKLDAAALLEAARKEASELRAALRDLPNEIADREQRRAALESGQNESETQRMADQMAQEASNLRARTAKLRQALTLLQQRSRPRATAFVEGEDGAVGSAGTQVKQITAFKKKEEDLQKRQAQIAAAITAIDEKLTAIQKAARNAGSPVPSQLDFKMALSGFKQLQQTMQDEKAYSTRLSAEASLLDRSRAWIASIAKERGLDVQNAHERFVEMQAAQEDEAQPLDPAARAEVAAVVEELRVAAEQKRQQLHERTMAIKSLRENLAETKERLEDARARYRDRDSEAGAVAQLAAEVAQLRTALHKAQLEQIVATALASHATQQDVVSALQRAAEDAQAEASEQLALEEQVRESQERTAQDITNLSQLRDLLVAKSNSIQASS